MEKKRTRELTREPIGDGDGDGSERKALILIDVRTELLLMILGKL